MGGAQETELPIGWFYSLLQYICLLLNVMGTWPSMRPRHLPACHTAESVRADARKASLLQPHDELAVRLIGLHQAMGLLDVREAEHLRRFCLVDLGGDPIDDVLERNLRKRKVRRSRDERAGEDAEMAAARNLEHRLERERAAAAEEAD